MGKTREAVADRWVLKHLRPAYPHMRMIFTPSFAEALNIYRQKPDLSRQLTRNSAKVRLVDQ
jgi:hypothetical protein